MPLQISVLQHVTLTILAMRCFGTAIVGATYSALLVSRRLFDFICFKISLIIAFSPFSLTHTLSFSFSLSSSLFLFPSARIPCLFQVPKDYCYQNLLNGQSAEPYNQRRNSCVQPSLLGQYLQNVNVRHTCIKY